MLKMSIIGGGRNTRWVVVSKLEITEQESCAIAKMTAQCALYTGALTTPTANFPEIFHGLLFHLTL